MKRSEAIEAPTNEVDDPAPRQLREMVRNGRLLLQQQLQQQRLFDKMAASAKEDEGVYTEESSANVTPRADKILRLSQRQPST